MSHDGSPQPFLGHFVTEVQHATQPRSYPTHFYVFEGATSPQILLSYMTSERLGILEFKVPNLAATFQIDDLSVPPSPTPSSKKKTAKHVTFSDRLVHQNQTFSTPSPQGLNDKRKTTSLQESFGNNTYIRGTQHKSQSNTPVNLPQPALVHHCLPKAVIPIKSALKAQLPKATPPCSISMVQDIMALRWAFPNSFDTIGNMSDLYHQDRP